MAAKAPKLVTYMKLETYIFQVEGVRVLFHAAQSAKTLPYLYENRLPTKSRLRDLRQRIGDSTSTKVTLVDGDCKAYTADSTLLDPIIASFKDKR